MNESITLKNTRDLNLLHRISQVLGFDLSLSDVLQVIVSVTADLMDSKIVSILLYDENTRTLSIAATQSLSPAYRDKPSVSADKSVSGKALLTHAPQAITDIASEKSFGFREIAQQEGIVSMLCVPMMIRGQAIGVINSYSQHARIYNDDDTKMLALVASQAAIAIENARLQSATAAFQEDLLNRKMVTKAKTLLMKKKGMDEPAAHRYIQKESMNRRKPMREIAEAILLSEELQVK
ncbi:MAG TPA: GAF domain-containing protein [bacterium]|jgi:GAF domain-containing protein|nr:GAF domain-containing protein [bacterium]